jgi:methionine-rich copper-binding protein CopC/alpha-tubulin suppressor-like RCC1 family protein
MAEMGATKMFRGHTLGEWENRSAFAALGAEGGVVTWGDSLCGGDSSAVASKLNGDVDVIQVFSADSAFAALRADGSVVSWGDSLYGGDSSAVVSKLNGDVDVIQVFSALYAFAALRADGSVVTWGDSQYGGDSSSVASSLNGDVDVTQIFSTGCTFAALCADGSVVTWGYGLWGGDSSAVASRLNGDVDVIQIFSTEDAYAALRGDGSVVTWGYGPAGGNSSGVASALNGDVDVIQIFSTGSAFAALRTGGSVVTWGNYYFGGDHSRAANLLNGDVDVIQIFSTSGAFAALRADGSVVTWGNNQYYNVIMYGEDSSAVASKLNGDVDVIQIFSTDYAFAALRADGSVVTWGDSRFGGDSSGVASALNGDVSVQIFSTTGAFAALCADGSVVTWGYSLYGGDSSAVASKLNGDVDVTQIFSTSGAFAALRADGSVVTWGDSSGVVDELVGVVDISNIYTDIDHSYSNPDETAPTVLTYSPADAATDVAVDSSVVLAFSEAVQLGMGNIDIHSGSAAGPLVESYNAATSGNLTINGNELTINPTVDLENNTHYFVTLVPGSIKDTAGNIYAGTSIYDFTTAPYVDTLAPTLSISSNVSEVTTGQTAAISFTFSEDPGTSFIDADITTTGGTLGPLSGSGLTRTAIFTPTAGVASGSASITVADGSYTDAAGNSGSAGVMPTITIHTVGTPSSISGLALSADTGASATDFITNVAAQTISATLNSLLVTGESLFGSIDNGTTWTNITGKVTGTAISWNGVTLSGTSGIQLEVRDASGNTGTPLHHAYQFDILAPTVVSITPANHLTGVDASENIVLTFSEEIQKGSGAIEIHSGSVAGPLTASYDVATSPNLAISGTMLTINPTNDLANDTHYYVTFAVGSLKDLAGNNYAGTATAYDFATEVSLIPMTHNGSSVMPVHYTGPATAAGGAPIQFQFIGDSSHEVVIGTPYNDFINVTGGVDAVDGGAGNDVIDGGTESNFLSGGAGTDIFFSDGRGGITTWSTITDWQAGEQLSVWGWNPGTSTIIAWVQDGAEGYKGLTMHADLNGDGTIDTSVTFTGIASQAQLPTPLEFDGLLWFN